MRLAVVSANYPSPTAPGRGTFVHALVRQMGAQGAEVLVVAPEIVRGRGLPPRGGAGAACESPGVQVLRPRTLSFSNRRLPGGLNTFAWSDAAFVRAVRRALDGAGYRPDVVYGHFLYSGGTASLSAARRIGVPAVVALGESEIDDYERHVRLDDLRRLARAFDGVVAVSEANRRYCVERLGVTSERILLAPNAADPAVFRPRDRAAMRRKHGLPADRPVVLFAGHFIERKGPLRLLAALRACPEAAAVFLGSGPQRPEGQQVLFAGTVPHEQVPEWMAASDLFVLPTLAEGSPNVVAEAMACGLPIVASDIPCIRTLVPDSAGVLVDPMDGEALARAIAALVDDAALRERCAAAALSRAQEHTLPGRARTILDWLDGIVRGHAATDRPPTGRVPTTR
jgi:glycosyltransferase involved in cell wall biosynthesis